MTLATDDDTPAPAESKGAALTITDDQVERLKELAQRILREPFTRRPWIELAFFLVSGGLAGVGLIFIGATMFLGVVLCITFFGLAFLGLSLRSARGMARWQRDLAHNLLGDTSRSPPPFVARPGFFGWLQSVLRDRVAWRAVGYFALKVPWTILGVYVAFSLWWDAFACLLRPLFWGSNGGSAVWGFFPNVFAPGANLNNGPIGFWHDVAIFVLGVIFLFAAPWVMRGFVNVDKLFRAPCSAPTPSRPASARSSRPGPRRSTRRRRRCGGSSATCTTERRRSWSRWPCASAWPRRSSRTPSTSTSSASASWSTRPTAGPRRPSPSCATSHGASTRRRSTSGWAAPWPPWPPAAPSRPRCTSTSRTRPTPAIEAIAYYCVAELLANVAQHAHASRAPCRVRSSAPGSALVVRDDGRGGARLSTVGSSSSGLAGLTDRVRTVDGRLDLVSPDGGPTVVTVDLPLSI